MRKAMTAAMAAIALALIAFGGPASSANAAPSLSVSVADDTSEVQLLGIRATGGQYRLRFGDGGPGVAETPDLPYDASGPQVEAALNALTNVSTGGGSVAVGGSGAVDVRDRRQFRISFDGGPLAGADVPELVGLRGASPLTGPYPDKLMVTTTDVAGMHRNDQRIDYAVRVRNDASTAPGVGDVLACNGTETIPSTPTSSKNWNPGAPGDVGFPEFTYQWARNGVAIPSATAGTYTVAPADQGTVIQCLVTGTNSVAAAKYASQPGSVISPVPAVPPPAPSVPTVAGSRPAITVSGVDRICSTAAMNWTGSPTYTFQWLRNGAPIPGATSSTYTPVPEDTNTQLQCQVVGSNAGGSLIGTSNHNIVGALTSNPNLGVAQNPSIVFEAATSGLVTVELELPAGLDTRVVQLHDASNSQTSAPIGWDCAVQPAAGTDPAKVICTRSDSLPPQQEYPPIGIGVAIGADAPDTATATATVSGGGALASGTKQNSFTFLPAVPFAIMPGTFKTDLVDETGNDYTQAGGHPFSTTVRVSLSHRRRLGGAPAVSDFRQALPYKLGPLEHVKQVRTDAPSGFVGNPLAPPITCDDPARVISVTDPCPRESVVGEVYYLVDGDGQLGGVWAIKALVAIEPERGAPAQFAFGDSTTRGVYVLSARLRPEDGYAVSIDSAPIVENPEFMALGASICGYGANGSYDVLGEVLAFTGCKQPGDPDAFDVPLLTNPTACGGDPLVTRLSLDSWERPGVFMSATEEEPLVTGCESVPFTPTVAMSPTSDRADSASGLDASIDVPADGLEDPNGISQAHLRKTVVELPEGVSVNPSAATGLEGCSDAQLGLKTDSEPSCPDGSKLGVVTATTPVLEETLSGVMVLRTPKSTDPESGEMLRVALVVGNDERGILVKQPGSAVADPRTGRLTATFDDNPQLPIARVEVKLRGGDRGVLAMPRDCGELSTRASLTPWSGNADAVSETSSMVDERCGDGFAPKLAAGNSDGQGRGQGGTYSFKFSREDGEQWLRGLTAKLPQGLLASVRDVPLCSNAAADAGSCPASSKIGVVDAKAGAGNPFVLEEKGEVFLTQGYKGGEYGLAVKIRPVAGPFRGEMELSPVIVRQAIHVDRTTAQVTAVSDPFPLVHHGIPLRVREVTVLVNRGGFMVNPSNCSQKQTGASLVSDEGATANLGDPFQVSNCAGLEFKPKLTLALTGRKQITTGRHPGIKAQVTQQGISEAGIEKAVVRLPKSLALDPNNAQALCEFADGTKPDLENHCPAGSIVGRARAKTPLLKDDLSGNVYFVKNVRRDPNTGNEIRTLPMIVVALRGEISINLKGESSTTKAGKLVNAFAAVPDAPITQFNLTIQGGSNGIVAVTRTRKARINLCAGRHIAEADMDGHNGRRHDTDIRMKTTCTRRQVRNAKRAAAKGR